MPSSASKAQAFWVQWNYFFILIVDGCIVELLNCWIVEVVVGGLVGIVHGGGVFFGSTEQSVIFKLSILSFVPDLLPLQDHFFFKSGQSRVETSSRILRLELHGV